MSQLDQDPYIHGSLGGVDAFARVRAMLMSLSLFGEARAIGVIMKGETRRRSRLTKSLSSSKYSTNKVTYLWWVKYID